MFYCIIFFHKNGSLQDAVLKDSRNALCMSKAITSIFSLWTFIQMLLKWNSLIITSYRMISYGMIPYQYSSTQVLVVPSPESWRLGLLSPGKGTWTSSLVQILENLNVKHQMQQYLFHQHLKRVCVITFIGANKLWLFQTSWNEVFASSKWNVIS